MRIMMVEVSKEELAANRRVADSIVDTLVNFLDNFTVPNNYNNNNDDDILEEEVDEDSSN